jgi:predicted CopG family antitoxin
MSKSHKKLTTISVSRENYLSLKELRSAGDSFNDVITGILKKTSLHQIRSRLATTNESEARATKIISEDNLGHDY